LVILVTGSAGFIGFTLSRELLKQGHTVLGVDNLNDYYPPVLKLDRNHILQGMENYHFTRADLSDADALSALFNENKIDAVINLAAQAGVRYSITNPRVYIDSNLVGFLNILEECRHHNIKHLIYASSSSVYGANKEIPFRISDNVDYPVSLYAATKKSNELMAHSYSHLYNLPTTGLRFFTVYGPWGRPDMAYYKFANSIMKGETIDVYNHGEMERDFTFVDDIVSGIIAVLSNIPRSGDCAVSGAPYRLYNIGNNRPVNLKYFISLIENEMGREASKRFLPMQPGDVPSTFADISDLKNDTGWEPYTSIENGIKIFIGWFKDYHAVK
jgi:UDP-glucuronate 4-epimerase